ncbi:MAG TPA: hypothetical protein VGS27_29100 [Candidatus Sulfotelmatobacter sp.]|nr:hypothetical protein [Candidatus Sulfotelmatobacter sp.]
MKQFESKPRRSWRLHVLAFGIAGFGCLSAEIFGYGWGASIAAAAGALIFTAIMSHRRIEKREHFWLAVTVLTLIQIPLIITVRPYVEHFRLPFLLAFAVADCLFVAVGIFWGTSTI